MKPDTILPGKMQSGPPRNGRVTQNLGSADCVVCVCAMIAGIPKMEAHKWAGTKEDEPWHDAFAAAFLLSRGIFMGMGVGLPDPIQIEKDWIWSSDIVLEDTPCYMAVKSKNPDADYDHAVFWDGQMVWDPHPQMESPLPLSEYLVSDFWPLYNMPYLIRKKLSNLRLGS